MVDYEPSMLFFGKSERIIFYEALFERALTLILNYTLKNQFVLETITENLYLFVKPHNNQQ